MHFTKLAAPLALAGLVAASPVEKRAVDDATVLQFALTLEHLEAAFYRESLDMYNAGAFDGAGFAPWVRQRFTEIASHEGTHVNVLTAGLTAAGAKPVAECQYEFGITSPETFLATAQILESVGVAAYLGAAPLISSKEYLGLAGSILIVEAQHQTWARSAADNLDGFPQPFAAPLNPNQVFTLASPFIKSCPKSNVALPFKAFPSVTINTKGPYKAGQKINITVPKGLSGKAYVAFASATGSKFQEISNSGSSDVTIPKGLGGQTYLLVTSGPSLSDASTIAGPAVLEIPVDATNVDYK